MNNNIPFTSLISLENNKHFLVVYSKDNGLIYQLNSALNKESNNFSEHALFVPTLLNIAISSIEIESLYNIIDSDSYFTSNYKNYKNEILQLKNEEINIIPSNKIINSKIYYHTYGQIQNHGIYTLANNKDEVDKIAFNYKTHESNITPISITKIEDLIKIKRTNNIQLISSELKFFKKEIKEQQDGKELWKKALLLSLLFFILEILLVKTIKR